MNQSSQIYGSAVARREGMEIPSGDDTFPAKVTAITAVTSEADRLSWEEQEQNPVTGAYATRPGGRSGTDDVAWAVAPSGTTFAADQIVWLRRHHRDLNLYQVVTVGSSAPAAGVARVRLNGAGSSTPGAKSAGVLTKRSGGSWVDLSGSVDVWLVEPNGGVLPDLTSGIAYHARDTGVDETVSSDTRRVYEAIVPPGVLTDWQCVEGTPTLTVTPVGV